MAGSDISPVCNNGFSARLMKGKGPNTIPGSLGQKSPRKLHGIGKTLEEHMEEEETMLVYANPKQSKPNCSPPPSKTFHCKDTGSLWKSIQDCHASLNVANPRHFEFAVANLCFLLKASGKELDKHVKSEIDRIFQTIRILALDPKKRPTTRMQLLKVIELRARHWDVEQRPDKQQTASIHAPDTGSSKTVVSTTETKSSVEKTNTERIVECAQSKLACNVDIRATLLSTDRKTGAKPLTQPGAKPLTQPGAKPLTQPRAKPLNQPGAKPLNQPGAKPLNQPGAKPLTQPGAKPLTQPGAKPLTQPGAKPLNQPGAKPLNQPGAKPLTQPGAKPLTQPGAKPPTQSGAKPLTQPGAKPLIQPGAKPLNQPALNHNTAQSPVKKDEGFKLDSPSSTGFWDAVTFSPNVSSSLSVISEESPDTSSYCRVEAGGDRTYLTLSPTEREKQDCLTLQSVNEDGNRFEDASSPVKASTLRSIIGQMDTNPGRTRRLSEGSSSSRSQVVHQYTRDFLLKCWNSPLCRVMPAALQHTIPHSDIHYIIRIPTFEDPTFLLMDDTPPPSIRSASISSYLNRRRHPTWPSNINLPANKSGPPCQYSSSVYY